MGPAIYVIAILGCGEGNVPCEQVRVAETQYQSEAACTEATSAQLERFGDLPYPIVVAQCRAAGATPALLMPSEVMRPAPGQRTRPVTLASASPR